MKAEVVHMSAPVFDPNQRDPAQVAPADSYRPDDPVWVHRDGGWRTGVVDRASRFGVMVTYRRTGHRGTGVDTVTAQYLVARVDGDPDLDRR